MGSVCPVASEEPAVFILQGEGASPRKSFLSCEAWQVLGAKKLRFSDTQCRSWGAL